MANGKWPRWVQRETAFLRMAAIELRHLADRDPSVAVELRQVARRLDAEAAVLAKNFPDESVPAA